MMHPRALIVILASLSMLGALSIDTYLPALPTIAQHFSIGPAAAQQTLSAFMFGYAFMTLFYGVLSDSFGRRPVILVALVVYLFSSLGAAWAPSFGWFIAFRFLQGISAGAGQVVGRAMVGDLFTGAQAQRTMSFIGMVFGIAPAVAPILGGWLQATLGWRWIFLFIAAFTFVIFIVCLRQLPESLEPARRHPFHFKVIVANYWSVGSHAKFVFRSLGNAFSFCGVCIYVGSAPAFVLTILHLTVKEFAWLFIPLIGGMTLGSMLAARMSHQMCPRTIIRLGYIGMLVSAVANVAYTALFTASVPWAVIAPFFYCVAMAFAMPAMNVMILEMFPRTRGLTSSLQAFAFMVTFGLICGVVCPLLFGSAFYLASGILVGVVLSVIFWFLGTSGDEGTEPADFVATPEEIPVEL